MEYCYNIRGVKETLWSFYFSSRVKNEFEETLVSSKNRSYFLTTRIRSLSELLPSGTVTRH